MIGNKAGENWEDVGMEVRFGELWWGVVKSFR